MQQVDRLSLSGPADSCRSWRSRAGIRFGTCSPSSSAWTGLRQVRPAGLLPSICSKPPTPTSSWRSCPASTATTSTISMHDDGRLTVSGVRRERAACEEYHRVERGHGTFSRTFHLPIPVDAERITADLRDGVLTVTCPKAPDGGGAPHPHHLAVRTCHAATIHVRFILLACFAAGLLVAGRLRDATEAGAQSPGAARPAVSAPGPVGAAGDAHRLQPHRRADRPRRRQRLGAADRPASGAARPVLHLLRRPG